MRNLGIKLLISMQLKSVQSAFIIKTKALMAMAVCICKIPVCYRMPVTNFAARPETHFGVKPNQMKEEFHTLKELFSVPCMVKIVKVCNA